MTDLLKAIGWSFFAVLVVSALIALGMIIYASIVG